MVSVAASTRIAIPRFDALQAALSTARSARFRAAGRVRLRTAARHAFEVTVLAMVIDGTWLLPGHPEDLVRITVANLIAVGLATAGFVVVRMRRHARVEVVLLGVLLATDGAIGMVIGIDVEVSLMCAGYVLLLPPIVALLIPWSTTTHLAWLVIHTLLVAMMSSLVPLEAHAFGGPRVLLGLLLVSSAVSVLGHLANLAARTASFSHIEQIRRMNRAARRDDARLRALNASLESMARTDQLTGLGNRAALDEQLAAMRSLIDRAGATYAVLMFDLDRFKGVNDELGHSAGDDVLRRVSRAMRDAMRAGDGAYRFGGEEFIAMVRLAQDDDAFATAERVRRVIERLAIAHPSNPPFGVVTASVGGCVVDRIRLAEPSDAWFACADRALYEAKRLGRNRSVVA